MGPHLMRIMIVEKILRCDRIGCLGIFIWAPTPVFRLRLPLVDVPDTALPLTRCGGLPEETRNRQSETLNTFLSSSSHPHIARICWIHG